MISLLPSRILKLLEFVGFSGNKDLISRVFVLIIWLIFFISQKLGLTELEKGSDNVTSLRGPLCSIILVAYHTVVCYVLGLADGDIDLASRILEPCLKSFPKGALFLFFAGRIEEIKGNINEELVYVWNGFTILGKRPDLLEPMLVIVEKTLNEIMENKESYPFFTDDYCLVLLLKGVCQKHRGQFLQAEQCFMEIIEKEKKIKQDTFIPPYATVELAMLYFMQDKLSEVKNYLERA
ncbi:hypothetical protein KUTeg_015811, partial [Tegillarca granosa]